MLAGRLREPTPSAPTSRSPSALWPPAKRARTLLDRLQAKGLLRRARHPEDRRSIVIELTDEGKALVPSLPPIFGRIGHQVFAGFSPEEIAQITDMLRRIMKNLSS